MSQELTCFKTYDIRGELGVNFDNDICYRIARAFALVIDAKKVIVGRDARATSPELATSLIRGLMDEGVTVFDIGLSGTEEMYWATTEFGTCGGIQVTASHNPINYNGLKIVKKGSRPLDAVTEFNKIKKVSEMNSFGSTKRKGRKLDIAQEAKKAYVYKIISFANPALFRPLKIAINSGNGAAGPTFDLLETELSSMTDCLSFEKIDHFPDSTFPNGIPNPLLVKNHERNRDIVLKTGADFGVAFDGDFDRCFFFDEKGSFIAGQYIVGLLASIFLLKEPGAKIVHDPRIIWNIQHVVQKYNGSSIISKTGHAYVKQTMRDNNAVYGGEISAHNYFRDFAYCDSGMIPWLLIAEIMSRSGELLSTLIDAQRKEFPSSGEINFELNNPNASIKRVVDFYKNEYLLKEELDGMSLTFEDWRLNLRSSNTEPLVRLNIESRGNSSLVSRKILEIKALLEN